MRGPGAPLKKTIRLLAPAVFWLGLWWLAAALVDQELFIPGPVTVLRRLAELTVTARFWRLTAVTLLRIVGGAAAGVAAGVLAAALTHASRLADMLLSPALRVVRAVPVASFIILVLLWVGNSTVPVVICALMVLPVVWESVRAGLAAPDPLLLEMAGAYDMSLGRRVRYIYLPYLRPHLRAGVLSSIGLAWKSGVAAEVLCIPREAIGSQVYYAKLYLDTPALFAWTFVVVVLSLLLEAGARRLLAREGGDEDDAV